MREEFITLNVRTVTHHVVLFFMIAQRKQRMNNICLNCIQWTAKYCSLDGKDRKGYESCGFFEESIIVVSILSEVEK